MSDIFREVDEALQQEKAAKFWQEYGPTLVGAALIIVIATGAGVSYRAWNHHRNAGETARLVTVMEQTNPSPADLQKIAQDTRGKHEALALFTAAGLLADKQDFAPAAALYKEIYEDRSTPRELSDLARVMHVRSALSASGDAKADDLIATLQPVLRDDKSVWQWPAKIDAALIAAHLQKDYKAAAAHLNGAEDALNLPPSLSQRAQSLHQLYTAQIPATEPVKETKE